MRAPSSLAALTALLACACAPAQPPVLDPNVAEFPESSLVDFGARRAARPSGFLSVSPAGEFVWPNGERARFWGINVAAESVFQPFDRIDTCVARIARAGFDLVRIHHVDGTARGILVGGADSQRFDPAKIEQLDYWIDACGRAGLSVYLDLLDYREFVPGDGVAQAAQLGRAAKPYALFDPRLVELQKQYAKALLRDRVNRFNGRAYADDPTIVLLELFDENGLFIKRALWPELVAPYRARLRQLFTWHTLERDLLARDGAVPAGWPRPGRHGISGPLPPHPWIEAGRLAPPLPFALSPAEPAQTEAERRQRADGLRCAEFAAWVHRAYYREMRDYLRDELGVRVPLTAIGDGNVLPDLQAVADELDFTGTNWYWDHPVFRAGRAWRMPFLFHYRNPLQADDPEAAGPKLALAKLHGKPLVVREWNVCFPNPHRAAGTVEAAVYAALQDVDAMILFTYGALPGAPKLSYFDVRSDPVRWGLAAPLGEIFRSRGVAPARRRIDLAHSRLDTLWFTEYSSETRRLAYVSRVVNRLYGDELVADADLTLTSGRSSSGRLSGGPRLLFRNDAVADDDGLPLLEPADWYGYPQALVQRPAGVLRWDGSLLLEAGERPRAAGGRFALTDLRRAGLKPLGEGPDAAAGFLDAEQRVIGFGRLSDREQVSAALDALRLWWGDEVGRADLATGRLRSDTGELLRDSAAGRLVISAPRVAVIAGRLGGAALAAGPLRITAATPHGALVIVSLDDRPLAETERFVAKLVSDAENRGMAIRPPGPESNPRDRWEMTDDGEGPIVTGGRAASPGLRVERGGRLWFAVGLAGGAFELTRDGGTWRWFCDTPGVTIELPGAGAAVAVRPDGAEQPLAGRGRYLHPPGVALVRADALDLTRRPAMTVDEVRAILAEHREELAAMGVASLSIFGSVARGEAGPESDVDLLVEFDRPIGLFEFSALQLAVSGWLGLRADLVMTEALRPDFGTQAEAEAVHALSNR